MDISLIIFDPGETTGFAALAQNGHVLSHAVFRIDELESFISVMKNVSNEVEVIVEIGPTWSHHSAVTKRAETICKQAFPSAHLVQPSQWKSHPVSKSKIDRNMSIHERDAVRLGRWFIHAKGIDTTRAYPTGT